MRYIIFLGLFIVSLVGIVFVSNPVSAVSTVSGETRMTSPVKPKPVLKATFSKSQIQKLTEQKKKILADIVVIKSSIAKYNASISDIKAKIDARKKAGISENADLEAKMKALKKAMLQDKKNLAVLMEKLAYIESKLK